MDVEAFSDTECVSNSAEAVEVDLLDGLDRYLKILDKHSIKSTLFTVGSLAPKIEDRLKKAIENGHRLALHNFEHTAPMKQTVESFREGVKKAKEKMTELFNVEIQGFRAPFFSLDDERLSVLKDLGFKYDSSYLDFSKARHTVKFHLNGFKECIKGVFRNRDFFEFSMSKQKIFGKPYPISGGGYVRLFNWGFVKGVIKHYLKNNEYYVFYLHPFELTQEKIPYIKDLKPYDKYYLNAGISNYGDHIEQLILMLKEQDYTFITFEELCGVMAEQ
jgi:peptidoglycan/xylan/chitin deacetylase (PgdA/CDA1 family)